jgi:integrase
VATILDAAWRTARDVHGVCLFQYSTGCRIGEALAMRWSAVDLEQARVTIRLRIHAGEVGPVKTANSLGRRGRQHRARHQTGRPPST